MKIACSTEIEHKYVAYCAWKHALVQLIKGETDLGLAGLCYYLTKKTSKDVHWALNSYDFDCGIHRQVRENYDNPHIWNQGDMTPFRKRLVHVSCCILSSWIQTCLDTGIPDEIRDQVNEKYPYSNIPVLLLDCMSTEEIELLRSTLKPNAEWHIRIREQEFSPGISPTSPNVSLSCSGSL